MRIHGASRNDSAALQESWLSAVCFFFKGAGALIFSLTIISVMCAADVIYSYVVAQYIDLIKVNKS